MLKSRNLCEARNRGEKRRTCATVVEYLKNPEGTSGHYRKTKVQCAGSPRRESCVRIYSRPRSRVGISESSLRKNGRLARTTARILPKCININLPRFKYSAMAAIKLELRMIASIESNHVRLVSKHFYKHTDWRKYTE